ncbi:sulfatase family protein [Rhodopirellula baltica]|uniref:Arylsulfatase A n=1 Tax=Rhodopirellula baltica WH47 TaxID=991778 RepID=F2ATR1_RHOBT|nr:sulfatase [Rhodopirellula baltica]EGF26895.1 arylsulfatase A [Rhodopirellula baltica WH47]
MRLPHLLALCLPAFFTALPASATAPEDIAGSRPNIVVIYMDDMAYADIGPFGAKGYSTPNLDRMANEGRKFTDFSVSSAVCSASRSALLTGCYHRRVGLSGALGPQAKIGLAPAETTFAEVCKSAGYRTACHGKWHLGHHPKFLPTNQGFDQFYGIPYSNDMWPLHPDTIRRQQKDPNDPGNWPPLPIIESIAGQPPRIVNDNVQPADQEQMTVELTRRSVEFIKNQSSDKPFLLYLPHPMVHVPLYVSERFRGKSGAGLFGDVMMEVDWSVGEILSAIESIDQQKNTLVIFTSDNGPWLSYGNHAGSAAPLREGKGTQWEGGVREPTVMWWPETIPAGTTCETFCSTIDVLPTIVELTGGKAPERKIDGHSILDLMLDVPGAKSPHESFVGYYGGGQLQTIRNERFKLVFPHAYRTLGDREPGKDGMPDGYAMTKSGLELYDLDADVSETTNVIEAHPEVVKQLQAAAEVYRQQLGDKLQKVKGSEIRGPGKLNENEPQLSW